MNEHVALEVPESSAYDSDFYAWSLEQARLLAERRFDLIDLPNIIEEIESLGRSQHSQLDERIARLLEHLIKLQTSSAIDPRRGWKNTVSEQRRRIERLLRDNPSLRREVSYTVESEWLYAVKSAKGSLEVYEREFVPPDRSFTVAEIMDSSFFPGD